jgi:hypothetical protein
MLRSKLRVAKPVSKAAVRPSKPAEPLRNFDWVAPGLVCLLAFLGLALLWFGNVTILSRVAQVGDRLALTASSVSITAATTMVPARFLSTPWASPGHDCVLDVSTMVRPGGTITVVALRPDGVMLSWAGGATALGTADCRGKNHDKGPDQGYLVSDFNYQRLAMAVTQVAWRNHR